MHFGYQCGYKERIIVMLTEFYNFYSKMPGFDKVVENQITEYLSGDNFSCEVFQNYFRHHQGQHRKFTLTREANGELVFTAEVWRSLKAIPGKMVPPCFSAVLRIDGYVVKYKCEDEMAYKLLSAILTRVVFVNGPAYHDNVKVDGEVFKMAYYIAACFYKLGGDEVGYHATLDEARDKL